MPHSRQPNIVFICLDTWRFDALSASQHRYWLDEYDLASALRTPNLDELAAESTYYSNAVATAPYTTVSVGSILTGAYPPRTGLRSFFKYRLRDDVVTVAEWLARNGYSTVAMGEIEGRQPTPSDDFLARPGVDVLRGFQQTAYDEAGFVQAVKRCDSPVFAWIHLWDMHTPYLWSMNRQLAAFRNDWDRKTKSLCAQFVGLTPGSGDSLGSAMCFHQDVARKLANHDDRVRVLFEWYLQGVTAFDTYRWPLIEHALRQAGLGDNTAVFVFGDHGEGAHPDEPGKNYFEHGQSVLDDVIRVPLIVRWPEAGRGRTVDSQVSLVDLVPTVVEMTGLPKDDEFDGQLAGRCLPVADRVDRRAVFAEVWRTDDPAPNQDSFARADDVQLEILRHVAAGDHYLYQQCVRDGRHKLVVHNAAPTMGRYVEAAGDAGERAFVHDWATDPTESDPAVARNSPQAEALMGELDRFVADDLYGGPIDFDAINMALIAGRLRDLGYVE